MGSKIPFLRSFQHQSFPGGPDAVAARVASAASSVCPSRTGADSLGLALVGVCPFGFAFPLAEAAIPSQTPCPAGPVRGAPRQQRGAGASGYGVPAGHGVPEGRMEEEGGGGRRWAGGEEVRSCSRPTQTTQGRDEREGKGRGSGKAAGGRPSLSLSPG